MKRTGQQGKTGAAGARGPRGVRGVTGATGRQGDIGKRGPKGLRGLRGSLHKRDVLETVVMHFEAVYEQLTVLQKRIDYLQHRFEALIPPAGEHSR